jgi:Uma2 family endonuclease
MSIAKHRVTVTEAEFLALPETMNKTELIDGEVVVAPSPTYWHQEVLGRIIESLRQWARGYGSPVTIGHSPLDVRFGPNRILQPDAFVLFARLRPDHKGPIDLLPTICVEIISGGDRVYDRITKRFLYAAAGVTEYWVIESAGLIERWSGPDLSNAEEIREKLTSSLLPGFELDIPALFAP